jgi:2-polyprenyl-3-methyl-5-hydroxy-6-metoxy-1,4-benzoquinol methylase
MDHWQSDIDHLAWLDQLGVKSFTGLSVLDLGCGSGFLCKKMMEEGAKSVIGVDMVKPENAVGATWQYRDLDLDSPAWSSQMIEASFDLILAFDILEHLRSPYEFLSNCQKLLKPKGRLVLTTPNINSWERVANPDNWSGARDQQHKTLFSRYSLQFLLKKSSLDPVGMSAPMRSLKFLGPLQPHIGGQILALAQKSETLNG